MAVSQKRAEKGKVFPVLELPLFSPQKLIANWRKPSKKTGPFRLTLAMITQPEPEVRGEK